VVTDVVYEVLGAARSAAKKGAPLPDEAALLEIVGAGVAAKMRPRLYPGFNLAGTVLHINLGRALLLDMRCLQAIEETEFMDSLR
jgi:L-seryl-tRNA(Ser) seleniumtransferase